MKVARVQIRRVYDPPRDDDGRRVLVDRLWPRGVRREDAFLDSWAKDLAPSPGLRKWFDHQPARFAEFRRRYRRELAAHKDALVDLRAQALRSPLTLVYAARDPKINHAIVLKNAIMAAH